MIGRSGKRGSGISVLVARHDDDDFSCLLASKLSSAYLDDLLDDRQSWI